jgi:hypothetical protein
VTAEDVGLGQPVARSHSSPRVRLRGGPLSREIVWFAKGSYENGGYGAAVTLFVQHDLHLLPKHRVVHGERFHTLFLDLSSPLDVLERSMTGTIRYEIKRAVRDNIRVDELPRNESVIEAFHARQSGFNRGKSIGRPIPVSALASSADWTLYSANRDGKWLADLLLISDGRRTRQWAAMSNSEMAGAMVGYASRALVWRSICDARARISGSLLTCSQQPAALGFNPNDPGGFASL